MTPDKLLAIHEAGHAVIAELLCLTPDHVTIESSDTADGHLRRRIPPTSARERWRELLVLCAGIVSEGIHSEEVELYQELRRPGDEGTDSARLWASLGMHSDDAGKQGVWFDLAFFQTQRILSNPPVWRCVESLAERLLEARTLDRWEPSDTISAVLGRPKWQRNRFRMGERYASPPQDWIESREEYRQMERAISAYATGGSAK
jgi:hypothetical protein